MRRLGELAASLGAALACWLIVFAVFAPIPRAGAITVYDSEQSWNVCLTGGPCRWFTMWAKGTSSWAAVQTADHDPSYTCGGCFVHVAATLDGGQVMAARRYGTVYAEVFAPYGHSFWNGPNQHDIKVWYGGNCYAMGVIVREAAYGAQVTKGGVAHVIC